MEHQCPRHSYNAPDTGSIGLHGLEHWSWFTTQLILMYAKLIHGTIMGKPSVEIDSRMYTNVKSNNHPCLEQVYEEQLLGIAIQISGLHCYFTDVRVVIVYKE